MRYSGQYCRENGFGRWHKESARCGCRCKEIRCGRRPSGKKKQGSPSSKKAKNKNGKAFEKGTNKPKNSPNVEKWIKKGGKVEVLEDGTWRYTDWEGNVVDYVNGYPIFKEPHLRQSVDIGKQKGDHTTDYTKAVEKSKKKPPKLSNKKTTWHHHEDGKTMQEVDKVIHKRFTHSGGASKAKKVKFRKR